jgi:hypothetical protein
MENERDILKGILDIHIHAGPSVANREVDAADMLKEAVVAGYRGFLVKDHYFPTCMGVKMVQEHFDAKGVELYSILVLNHSVGLFNLLAVDAAVNMGAKIISFPTVSAKNHIDHHKGNFVGAGKMSVPENPVVFVDKDGNMDKEAIEVIKLVAARDVTLATGHGTAWEIDHLVEKAFELGVKRVLVNHPHFHIGASYEQMAKWAAMGAFIELNVCVFVAGSSLGDCDDDVIANMLKAVPLDRLILDSDMGQKGNGSPVDGMFRFIKHLMNKFGLTESDINQIAKKNPAILLGI